MNVEIANKISEWLLTGQVGESSKAMASAASGIACNSRNYYPRDPADFNRCLLLLEAIPEIKNFFSEISQYNKYWSRIIKN